jgi:hypothetical protein
VINGPLCLQTDKELNALSQNVEIANKCVKMFLTLIITKEMHQDHKRNDLTGENWVFLKRRKESVGKEIGIAEYLLCFWLWLIITEYYSMFL